MNKVILMGRLTADPELKYTPNNIAVTAFSLAINRRFQKEITDFINIVAWRQTAEFVTNYFKKGMQVAIIGSIQTRNWKDKEGNTRYATEVAADEVYFADSKKDSSAKNTESPFDRLTPQPAAQATRTSTFEIPTDSDFSKVDDDDDLPF